MNNPSKTNKKFQVYAQVRATRQLASDIANELQTIDYANSEWRTWDKIADMLERIEGQLEGMVK